MLDYNVPVAPHPPAHMQDGILSMAGILSMDGTPTSNSVQGLCAPKEVHAFSAKMTRSKNTVYALGGLGGTFSLI